MTYFNSNVLPAGQAATCMRKRRFGSAKTQLLSFLFTAIAFFSAIALNAQNPIAVENAKAGSPASEWDVTNGGDQSIIGFATQMSVNKGQTVRFKIKTNATGYKINIYRLGYYNGLGARKIGTGQVTATLPQTQPVDNYDLVTGMTDCSNWSESASFTVPSDAVSGIYLAKMIRNDNGGANHIVFIVRDDAASSDLLFKTSDATWQAYNNYGGNSFYQGSLYGNVNPIPVLGFLHATKISYDRPFNNRNGGRDWFNIAEMPMIRFLERNGFDMSYTTCVDMAKPNNGFNASKYKVIMSVGHDEYWSAEERSKFETARNGGVNLAFFSGNEVYWKTRWENNFRTLVCYKEGKQGELQCYDKCDPVSNVWTGLWRSGCDWPDADGCNPENALSGQISWSEAADPIEVPASYKDLRFWRNTSITSLAPGQKATLAESTIGFEFDFEQWPETYPNGRITMSETKLSGKVHKLSLYRHASGAWVFGAGTIQWSWGLDNYHGLGNDDPGKTYNTDVRMQQATINLFADMGAQPATLQNDLVKAYPSTDNIPPVSVIATPANALFSKRKVAIIKGEASDIGGTVAGVEVSLDGGVTWQPAEGTKSWTFMWTPEAEGTLDIKVRSFDDSGNFESVPASSRATVGPESCPCTVFEPYDTPDFIQNDNLSIETGLKFQSSRAGVITGVRFYKAVEPANEYIGHLWTVAGTLLGTAVFDADASSGWKQAMFQTPVPIQANTTYIVSVFSKSGDYVFSRPYFDQTTVENGPLTALADGQEGPNGVFIYSNTPAFPIDTYRSTNYWVDAVFNDLVTNSAPVLTLNPVSQSSCGDDVVTITSAATGTPTPTVQWQESINGTTWTNISGAKSATLTITGLTGTKQYRAIWTNSVGSVTSSPAVVTVSKVVASVSSKNNAACTNGSVTITQSGGIAPYTYSINDGPFQSSATFGNLSQGTYSVLVKDAKGCTAVVPNIVITQSSTLSAFVFSKNDASCANNDGNMYVVAYFGSYPYQYSLNGVDYQSSGYFSDLQSGVYTVYVKDAKGCNVILGNIKIDKPAPINAVVSSKTNESCAGNDASVTISATGGSGYYQYSLNGGSYQSSNTFKYLSEGTYSVAVKDYKGCTASISNIVITQNSSVTASVASKTASVCGYDNGSLTITASGGTAPYYFILSNGRYQTNGSFTNLEPGTYTVWIVDSKKCFAIITGISISETTTLNLVTNSVKNTSCAGNDGSISVAASGGKPTYQYSLNGGRFQYSNVFTGLSYGRYRVTVKDSKGCTKTLSNIDIAYTQFKAFASKVTGESCFGKDGSVKITTTGGTGPYQFKINGGRYFKDSDNTITGLCAGTYTVTVKDDKDCVTSISGIVVPATKLTASVSKTNACSNVNNGTITITAQGGIPPYQYSLNGYTYKTSNVFTGLSPATYFVLVKDAKGCITYISGITISRSSTPCNYRGSGSDEEVTKNKSVKPAELNVAEPAAMVFPNPTSGAFNVQVTGLSGMVTVRIIDALGKEIENKQVTVVGDRAYVPFNLGGKAKGVYHVSISSGKQIISQKVVIQ